MQQVYSKSEQKLDMFSIYFSMYIQVCRKMKSMRHFEQVFKECKNTMKLYA